MTPGQCRAARGFLDISQEDLAKAANVGLSTVRNFEKRRSVPIGNNLAAIQAELEKWGVRFADRDESGSLGVFYAEPQKDTAAQA